MELGRSVRLSRSVLADDLSRAGFLHHGSEPVIKLVAFSHHGCQSPYTVYSGRTANRPSANRYLPEAGRSLSGPDLADGGTSEFAVIREAPPTGAPAVGKPKPTSADLAQLEPFPRL